MHTFVGHSKRRILLVTVMYRGVFCYMNILNVKCLNNLKVHAMSKMKVSNI